MPRLRRKEFEQIDMPADELDIVWQRIEGMQHESMRSSGSLYLNGDFLKTLMLSCYTQGLMDGQQIPRAEPLWVLPKEHNDA